MIYKKNYQKVGKNINDYVPFLIPLNYLNKSNVENIKIPDDFYAKQKKSKSD